MKSLVLMLSLVVSFTAQAGEYYRCTVAATPKGATYSYELGMYLSTTLPSTLKVAQTELKLRVSSQTKEFVGTVNGQPNFLLEGNVVTGGKFESAYATGTIACQPTELSVVLYNAQFNEIYVPVDTERRLSLTSVKQLPISCYYAKDSNEAANALAVALSGQELALKPVDYAVEVIVNERQCLDSRGQYDEYECTRWSEPKPKVYTLKSCFQPPRDPR